MSYISRMVKHERLMTRMADRNGADIDVALLVGALTPGDLHEATFRCMGCTQASACERRLETDAAGVPGYCRNAEMIEDVRTSLQSVPPRLR